MINARPAGSAGCFSPEYKFVRQGHGVRQFALLRLLQNYRQKFLEKQAYSIIIPEIGTFEPNPDAGII